MGVIYISVIINIILAQTCHKQNIYAIFRKEVFVLKKDPFFSFNTINTGYADINFYRNLVAKITFTEKYC